MRKCALLVALAVSGWSCAQKRTVQAPQPPPAPTGVAATFQRQVINAVDAGEGDFEIRTLRARMAADPDNLRVRLELARRYRQSGFPELAAEHYRLAAVRFPDSDEVQLELARCLRQMGLKADAARGLEAFVAARPNAGPEAYTLLGILRDDLGQWEQGEAAYRQALKLAPKLDSAHNNLGWNLLQQGRAREAQDEFRMALALRPDSKLARNNLGLAMAADQNAALQQLSLAADPASAHNNLACILIEQGRYTEARKELEIALGYTRNHPAALNNLRLLTELDGQAATVPVESENPGTVHRAWSAFWRVLAGIEEPPRRNGVKTATR